MKQLTEEQQNFAEHLQTFHLGKDNSIVSKRLRQFGNARYIRRIVHDLRVAGVPICSGQTGYYYASNSSEVYKAKFFIHSMMKELKKAYNGLNDTYYEMKHEEDRKN